MATVDVEVQTVIHRPRPVVAAYCCEPDNATAWYANIEKVRWKTPRPMAVGSRFTFTAHFLGRTLNYTYEVVDWLLNERLVMRTPGPLTTYLATSRAPIAANRPGPPPFIRSSTHPVCALSLRWRPPQPTQSAMSGGGGI